MEKQPIRVLQCVSNMDRAGIETMLMNYYRKIDKNKIQFDFLCNKPKKGDYNDEIVKLGGKIYVSPGLNPFKWYSYQKYMNNLFKAHPEYKIIHCQNEVMGYPALYAAKKNNLPIRIAHSHNTKLDIDYKLLVKLIYKQLIKNVSNYHFACSEKAGNFLFGKDYSIIKNAIDIEKFKFNSKIRNEMRKKLNLQNNFVIGNVARFEKQKNHIFLINLFNEIHKINKNTKLLLVGEGSLKHDIEKRVKRLGIEKDVIFMGNIKNVNDIYQAMDVFVLPSLHEGLPVVGIEAQTSGLRCIFSDEITKEVKLFSNVKFLNLKKNSIDEWTSEILEDSSMKDRINAYKNAEDKGYSIDIEAKKLQQMYIDLYNKATSE